MTQNDRIHASPAVTTQSALGREPADVPEPSGRPGRLEAAELSRPSLRILVANEQSAIPVDPERLQSAARSVLGDSCYSAGMLSIAVVDDTTIHQLNRQFLGHDYPTDVLSFVLENRRPYLEGELILSGDTALHNAAEYGWPAEDELLLYVVHGCLHLVGYCDQEPAERAEMLAAELAHLRMLQIGLPTNPARWLGQVQETLGEGST